MITKDQALTASEFHYSPPGMPCQMIVGPRGGLKIRVYTARRNGRTQTWVRQPERYRVPVKYGLRDAYSISQYDAPDYHVREECPLIAENDLSV